MPDHACKLDGFGIFECAPEGPALRHGLCATDLIGCRVARAARARRNSRRASGRRLFCAEDRIAGEVLQKVVTYRMRVAIIADYRKSIERRDRSPSRRKRRLIPRTERYAHRRSERGRRRACFRRLG